MASILVTGASKGIGMSAALVLARAGHTVHATMRNPSASQLGQAAESEGLPIHISVMDVDTDVSVADGIAVIQAEHGPIDVLVNNAGIEVRGTTEELDFSQYKAVMETNYFGSLRTIQAVLPSMRVRRSGLIINVTSVTGHISCSPLGGYAASKFALEALSEALAQEMRMHNVRVAIVEPGIIDTAMAQRITHDPPESSYPHTARFARLFATSLQNPVSPDLVGEKILEVVNDSSGKLRYPVGPDAEPFLAWRAGMTDEEFVAWNGVDDETWYNNVERDFGLNARP